MKLHSPFFPVWAAALALGGCLVWADASRDPDVRAARADRINIRAQPTIQSEVLGQLNSGDRVTVLEAVKLSQPKAGDATNWLKIALPAAVPVWVHAAFVDTNKMLVTAPRLNVRAGPGENFSVVGRVERGEKLKVIRQKEEWLQVAPPAGSSGFVAADFFTAPSPPAVVAAPPPIETPAPVEPPPPATSVVVVTPPVVITPPAEAPPPPPAETPAAKPAANWVVQVEAAPRRIVTREGMVRFTVHVNAPSWYVLESLDTRAVINYLHAADTNVVLANFRDRRVLVTGEEGLDRRWPNTPVLRIHKAGDIQQLE